MAEYDFVARNRTWLKSDIKAIDLNAASSLSSVCCVIQRAEEKIGSHSTLHLFALTVFGGTSPRLILVAVSRVRLQSWQADER